MSNRGLGGLILCLWLCFDCVGASATPLLAPAPDTGDERLDLHIHDPSRIIASSGYEIVAVTGKAQEDGYACGLELWRRTADPLGTWRMFNCLLTDKPAWVKGALPSNDGAYWAPDFVDHDRIIYSVADDFETGEKSCLGLVLQTETGLWRDRGRPLVCLTTGEDSPEASVIDPSIFTAPDGPSYLVTGGGVIRIAEIDRDAEDLALPEDLEGPGWTDIAIGPIEDRDERGWVEAAHIVARDGYFYLFVNWGACCRGAGSTYEIRVGRANTPHGPYVDSAGTPLMQGGGALLGGGGGWLRGPGHSSVRRTKAGDVLSFHYYDARRGGLPWIGEVYLDWRAGWPDIRR